MKMNKKAAACMGLGAAVLIGGSFAYYSQTTSLENPLSTGHYTSQLVEEFTPPTEELKPGQKWDKVVGAENTGDYPVLVRVRMDEKWMREGNETPFAALESIENDTKNDKFTAGTYANNIFDAEQFGDKATSDTDGLTDGDSTVVYKKLNIVDSNDPDSAKKWIDGGDGYWYWNGVLEKGGSTGPLMDYLVLANDIDLGLYETKEYWAIADKGTETSKIESWTLVDGTILDIADKQKENIGAGQTLFRKSVSELDANKKGYADANYTLTVTAEFVQATTDAVKASWCGSDDKAEAKYNAIMAKLTNVAESTSDPHLTNK